MNKCFALLACAAAAAFATAASGEDRLVSPPLQGFVVGYQAESEAQSIREEVLKGETVERWTAMVTTQRFAIPDPDIAKFAPAFLGSLKAGCPNAANSAPARFEHFGNPAALFSADCPSNPATGQRETMNVLAIAKGNAVFVKQVAFRGNFKGDTAWAVGFLRATRLCDEACRD